MVTQALLDELGIIIEQDYGIRLKPEAVSEIGNSLVGFFDLLAKHNYQTEPKKGGDGVGNTNRS